MEGFSISNSVSEKDEILKKLLNSLLKGKVVGIFLNDEDHTMCLTAVEDIIKPALASPVIVLKRLDLHGIFINQNRIDLNDINKVRNLMRFMYQ